MQKYETFAKKRKKKSIKVLYYNKNMYLCTRKFVKTN